MGAIQTKEEFKAFVAEIQSDPVYRAPWAFGIGIAYLNDFGDVARVDFPFPNRGKNDGAAAVFAYVLGHKNGTATYSFTDEHWQQAKDCFNPFWEDGQVHGNIDALREVFRLHQDRQKPSGSARNGPAMMCVVFIGDPDDGIQSTPDSSLRLHLLNLELASPDTINLYAHIRAGFVPARGTWP